MSATEPLISLCDVGAFFWRRQSYLRSEKFWALQNVTFDLYQGESLGVIGRNGAGKSTLLKLLTGIIKPDKGKLINNGAQAALLSLQLGFVPYLTGRENAVLSGMLLGLHKAEVEAKMDNIIQFSELGGFFDDPIKTYSSGMLARLGFSVAFQLDPDILLIDEILGVGDAEFHKKSTEVMHEKIRSNKTIVLVSHQSGVISELCDRVVWIENGVTQLDGSPSKVLSAYQTFLDSAHH